MTMGINGNTIGRPTMHLTDAEKIERFDKQQKIKAKHRAAYRMISLHKEQADQLDNAIDFISNELGIKLTKSQGLKYLLAQWSTK